MRASDGRCEIAVPTFNANIETIYWLGPSAQPGGEG